MRSSVQILVVEVVQPRNASELVGVLLNQLIASGDTQELCLLFALLCLCDDRKAAHQSLLRVDTHIPSQRLGHVPTEGVF